MHRTIVKEGPLVFIINVIAMEIILAVLLYIASFLQNYEMLYRNRGFDALLRYDLFLIVTFSALQLFYVSTLFLEWYFSYFEITPGEVIKKSGLLFRRRKSIAISSITAVEISESPLERLMLHSTITLHRHETSSVKIRNVANAEEYAQIIKRLLTPRQKRSSPNILSIVQSGENGSTEFKETLRYDTRKNAVNKDLEQVAMKSITAFLNSRGGTLIFGVDNDGKIKGLEKDYDTLPKKDRDGFENHLSMLVKSAIGVQFGKYIEVEFEKIEGKEICAVFVSQSHKPAYLKTAESKESFFVRMGNSSQPFSMSETEEYIKSHL